MSSCSKCKMPLEVEEEHCPCNGSICVHCCECDGECGCGCKDEGEGSN